jgi:hypothetical protein
MVQPRDMERGAAAAAPALGATGAEPASVDGARSRAAECVRVAREAGDLRGECDGLTGLARAALRDGDSDRRLRERGR